MKNHDYGVGRSDRIQRGQLFVSLLVCTVIFMLAACGFEPLYGKGGQVRSQFRDVEIAIIPDREGQVLRNELIDRIHTSPAAANPRYQLVVSPINEVRRKFDIQETSDTTRTQLQLQTSMRLIDRLENKLVIRRALESFASYNVLESLYATRVSREDARKNALNDLARQIERQLALYFTRDATSEGGGVELHEAESSFAP